MIEYNKETLIESYGMCEGEDIMRYSTMMKEINIQKTKKIWVGNISKRYEDSDESLKRMETLDNGYLCEMWQYVCKMMIPIRRCDDEEPSHKVWFNLNNV